MCEICCSLNMDFGMESRFQVTADKFLYLARLCSLRFQDCLGLEIWTRFLPRQLQPWLRHCMSTCLQESFRCIRVAYLWMFYFFNSVYPIKLWHKAVVFQIHFAFFKCQVSKRYRQYGVPPKQHLRIDIQPTQGKNPSEKSLSLAWIFFLHTLMKYENSVLSTERVVQL